MKTFLKLFILLLVVQIAKGQNPDDYTYLSEKYSERNVVYLNVITEVHLTPRKDDLQITQRQSHDMYFTNDKSALYTKNSIETSYFRELLNFDAYSLTRDGDKNKYKKHLIRNHNQEKRISTDLFYDDVLSTTYEYQNLQKGSIAHLSYTVNQTLPHFPMTTYFGYFLPVISRELIVHTDKNVDIEVAYINSVKEDYIYTSTVKGAITTHKWKMENIDKMKYEESAPSSAYFMPHIIVYVKSFQPKKGPRVNVLRNVDDLYAWYTTLLDRVKITDDSGLRSIISEIINDEDDEVTKVKKVYSWVQNNIKYIALADGLGGFVPRDPDLVLSRRYGDCKDMSMLVVALLKLTNVEAYPAWVGTRDIPYSYHQLPTPAVDNHMIVAYRDKTTNKYMWLDPTDSHLQYGIPSEFIQGKEALISLENGYYIDTIPIVPPKGNSQIDSIQLFIDGDMLKGKAKVEYTGYLNTYYRAVIQYAISEIKKEELIRSITQKGSNKYILKNYSIKQIDDDKILVDYDFEVSMYVNSSNNELFINLNLDKTIEEHRPYKSDRKLAVENDFKNYTHYVFELRIPDGYQVKFIPDNHVYNNDLFSFFINYETDGTTYVKYESGVTINYLILQKEELSIFNEMLRELKSAYKENVVLKKINVL